MTNAELGADNGAQADTAKDHPASDSDMFAAQPGKWRDRVPSQDRKGARS